MIKVALTGGIGSGKTTVAQIFQALDVPIYYSDKQAKQLMTTLLREPLGELLGNEAFQNDGNLNSKYIASKIFTSPELLAQINALVHPAVSMDFLHWANQQNAPYVIVETALLLESKLNEIVDKIITVTAPLELRLMRASQRDSVSVEKIRQRMVVQTPQEVLINSSDYIIDTTPGQMIVPNVVDIDGKLRGIAKCKK